MRLKTGNRQKKAGPQKAPLITNAPRSKTEPLLFELETEHLLNGHQSVFPMAR